MPQWLQLALAFVFGGGGLALIEWARDSSKFKRERKAQKEDRMADKQDELKDLKATVEALSKQQTETLNAVEALQGALKCVLLDRIMHLGQSFIADGSIDFDDRRRLREMHDSYHYGLKGNGDADAIMKAVDALPLKNHG